MKKRGIIKLIATVIVVVIMLTTLASCASLQGLSGKDGVDGKDGKDGINGSDGKDGVVGEDGKDGVGIASTTMDANGSIVITYTDGTVEVFEHNWTYAYTLKDPTCTETGIDLYSCKYCNLVRMVTIEMLSHTESEATIENNIEPTCTTEGLYGSVIYCTVCNEELSRIATKVEALGHSYIDGTCELCGAKDPDYVEPIIYVRCDKDGTPNENGDYILFGEYPQTIKADDVIITSTIDDRGYYLGSDGFYYAAVTATPKGSNYTFSTDATIVSGIVYYFKVEPICWRILSTDGETAFIYCDSIIDHHKYDSSINNYADSEIRTWLNAIFYETSFVKHQREVILTTTVDNSVGSTGYLSNQFVCEDTEDKIFLLSYAEVKNSECGFALQTSDYSRATGVYMDTNTSYYGIGYWWLRSPTSSHSGTVHAVDRYGLPSEINWVYHSFFGVVPAMWINLNP